MNFNFFKLGTLFSVFLLFYALHSHDRSLNVKSLSHRDCFVLQWVDNILDHEKETGEERLETSRPITVFITKCCHP